MRLGMMLGAGGVAAAGVLGASATQAAPVAFDLTTVAVDYNNSEPGLVVDVEVSDLPSPFALDEGESFTFDLFTISSAEWGYDADDYTPQTLTATLYFAGMDPVTVEGTSYTSGQSGQGVADFPAAMLFNRNGIDFLVQLSDAMFPVGEIIASRLDPSGTVTATISRPGGNVVPTPAAAAAGLALLGGAAARRRR